MKITTLPCGLGDELAVTPSVRELRRLHPKEKVALHGFRHPEIWDNNPYLGGGTQDHGAVYDMKHFQQNGPTLSAEFARGFGLVLGDDRPEIFLSENEKAIGARFAKDRPMAICTHSSGTERRWPLDRWQRLVSLLTQKGHRVVEVGRHDLPPLSGVENLRHLGLRHVAAALASCSLFIGTDSGLFHVAAAVGCPQVVLFSIIHSRCRAYKDTVAIDEPCSCDRQVQCRQRSSAKCLENIPAERVLEALPD